jgi:hypothetical protein
MVAKGEARRVKWFKCRKRQLCLLWRRYWESERAVLLHLYFSNQWRRATLRNGEGGGEEGEEEWQIKKANGAQ